MLQYSNGECSDRTIKGSLSEFIVMFIMCLGMETIMFVWGVLHVTDQGGHGGFAILVGILVLFLHWWLILEYCTKYKVSEEGLLVKYPLEKWELISWKEFQEVCVCYHMPPARNYEAAYVVICCVKHGEQKNVYGRWKDVNPLRFRSVIRMDYTEELHKEVKKNCPYKVKDLRETGTYRVRSPQKFF